MIMNAKDLIKMAVLGVFLFVLVVVSVDAKKDERDCEVCISTISKFKKQTPEDLYSDQEELETKFREFCEKFPSGGKENRFCYFVGGTKDAATGILNHVIKPLSYHLPPEKICEKLKVMDSQICQLRFDVKPDFSKLNKMKVGELKRILSNWGEDMACKGCVEKPDFVKKVQELLPKHEPEEWRKIQAAEKDL